MNAGPDAPPLVLHDENAWPFNNDATGWQWQPLQTRCVPNEVKVARYVEAHTYHAQNGQCVREMRRIFLCVPLPASSLMVYEILP